MSFFKKSISRLGIRLALFASYPGSVILLQPAATPVTRYGKYGHVGQTDPLTVLTLYSVKTGLAATRIYGLMDALSPAIWVGSRLGRGVI